MLKDWFPSGTKFHIEISDFCVYFPSCDKRASHTLAYYTELHQTVPASAPKFVLGWLYNAFLHMFDKIIYYKRTCVRLYTYIYTYIYASIFCQVMKKSDTTKSNMFFFFHIKNFVEIFLYVLPWSILTVSATENVSMSFFAYGYFYEKWN